MLGFLKKAGKCWSHFPVDGFSYPFDNPLQINYFFTKTVTKL